MNRFWLVTIFCIFIGACHDFESPVSSMIAKKVSNGEGTLINIAQLTSFNWDKLYIFKPYSSNDIINEAIHTQLYKNDEFPMGVPEGNTLFVFLKDDKIVHYFMHPRSYGDFSDFQESYVSLTPGNSTFVVIRDGSSLFGKWYKLGIVKDRNGFRP